MNTQLIEQVIKSDFLSIEEQLAILHKNGINIESDLVDYMIASDIDIELKMKIIKAAREYKNNKKTLEGAKNKTEPLAPVKNTKRRKSRDEVDSELKESKATRPLNEEEFKTIIATLKSGVKYIDKKGSKRRIEPNPQVALILSVQATLGFRINDVLRIKLKDIRGSKISFIEQKTKKLQYRKVNIDFIESLQDYADENEIGLNDYLFSLAIRNVQAILKKVTEYLGYNYIGTHSFRKFYAVSAYKASNNNLELVRSLLNHSSISVTQRYINVAQDEIDEYSASVNFVEI